MQILQAPDQILATPAKEITQIKPAIKALIEDMKKTLVNTHDPEGVGLAAPQIGKSLQLFIIKPSEKSPFSVFINPQIQLLGTSVEKPKKEKDDRLEGCLSLKNIWGTVKRAQVVKISYLDENGIQHKDEIYKDFPAVILQHEYDHLQGILFSKRVLEQKGKLYKSHKNEKGEEVFDPLEI